MFISSYDQSKYFHWEEFREFNKVLKKKMRSLYNVTYQQPLLALRCINIQIFHPYTAFR